MPDLAFEPWNLHLWVLGDTRDVCGAQGRTVNRVLFGQWQYLPTACLSETARPFLTGHRLSEPLIDSKGIYEFQLGYALIHPEGRTGE
jgi:hypothetical protein